MLCFCIRLYFVMYSAVVVDGSYYPQVRYSRWDSYMQGEREEVACLSALSWYSVSPEITGMTQITEQIAISIKAAFSFRLGIYCIYLNPSQSCLFFFPTFNMGEGEMSFTLDLSASGGAGSSYGSDSGLYLVITLFPSHLPQDDHGLYPGEGASKWARERSLELEE